MKQFKSLIIILLLLTLTFGVVGTAQAFDIRSGNSVKIAATETIEDDVILSGMEVVIDGVVNGDVIANASKVIVNGTVNGSLMMSGQTLLVNGTVNGSVYGASASLVLGTKANIKRNLVYAGASFKMEKGSVVGRDVLVAGYQTLIEGEVGRDLKSQNGALEIHGVVKRDIDTTVAQPNPGFGQSAFFSFIPGVPAFVDPGLRILPKAQVGGKLNYTSSAEQASEIKAQPAGGVTYQFEALDPEDAPDPFPVFTWLIERVRQLLTLCVLGALVVWRVPEWLKQFSEMVHDDALSSVGWGLVVWVGGYLAVGVVAVAIVLAAAIVWVITLGELFNLILTVGFALLAIIGSLFWLLISYGGQIILAYLVGQWVSEKFLPKLTNVYVWLLLGIVFYVFVAAIPLLGWLASIAATLVGVGAMWLTWREHREAQGVS